MQELKIPQSQIIATNGMMATEWLVFINEFIRLSNAVIASNTISKADAAEFNSVGQAVITGFDADDEISTYLPPMVAYDEQINNIAIDAVRDEQINNVAMVLGHDERIDNTTVLISNDDLLPDNPYALLTAIGQQQYEQQIWSLTV